ncbi:TIGR01777 family oxidoreductase [Salidesulfovibrio onnuriiensis]|uniref:TIGR01777 family oxidoreductase n=1 Tax=Salidesulfovibrio onnuriiensis TaxID=2583823 RepID=UPI0011C9CA53|nr:TIGR01777 family oxidoreductase [Salidesulfovibrio onnuriiensis]
MRAIIAGGTGFIGRALCAELLENGWEVVILSRKPSRVGELFDGGVIGMDWDGGGHWDSVMGKDTVVVNLAGENIAGRWTEARKRRILESRLMAGQRLVDVISQVSVKPRAFVQASAVGYYGPHKSTPQNEECPPGTGFLADVTRQWEASTRTVGDMGVRRVVIRTGVVLGQGGALAKMLPLFRLFLGGPTGHGHQGMSWIHLADEAGAIRFLMENEEERGAYNLVAPAPCDNNRFAHTLGRVLGRPSWLRVPAAALRTLFGQMADEVLLTGQFALPEALQRAGYQFRFPDLEGALRDILSRDASGGPRG